MNSVCGENCFMVMVMSNFTTFQITVAMGYEVVTDDTQTSSQILDTLVSGDSFITQWNIPLFGNIFLKFKLRICSFVLISITYVYFCYIYFRLKILIQFLILLLRLVLHVLEMNLFCISGTIHSNHVQLIKPNLQPFTLLRGQGSCTDIQAPATSTIFNKV